MGCRGCAREMKRQLGRLGVERATVVMHCSLNCDSCDVVSRVV